MVQYDAGPEDPSDCGVHWSISSFRPVTLPILVHTMWCAHQSHDPVDLCSIVYAALLSYP
jgi:hypothetical protein